MKAGPNNKLFNLWGYQISYCQNKAERFNNGNRTLFINNQIFLLDLVDMSTFLYLYLFFIYTVESPGISPKQRFWPQYKQEETLSGLELEPLGFTQGVAVINTEKYVIQSCILVI